MDDFFEDGLTSGFVDFMVEQENEEERRRKKLEEEMLNPDDSKAGLFDAEDEHG
jgi:hypothetical protein